MGTKGLSFFSLVPRFFSGLVFLFLSFSGLSQNQFVDPTLNETEAIRYLRLRFANAAGQGDECILRIDSIATEGFDSELEAYKLDGAGLNLAMPVENYRLSIQAIPGLGQLRIVPLQIKGGQEGIHSLKFQNLIPFIKNEYTLSIRDYFLGTLSPIDTNSEFYFSITPEAESQGLRFELVFARIEPVQNQFQESGSDDFSIFPNPINEEIQFLDIPKSWQQQQIEGRIIDLNGREIRSFKGLGLPINLRGIQPCFYVLELRSGLKIKNIRILKRSQ